MNENAPMKAAPSVRTQFSLNEGDLVNRVFGFFGIGARRPLHLLYRSLVLTCLTWMPLAVLALVEGLYSVEVTGSNFFADFAAYAQFLVALPIFVVAEAIVVFHTREAAKLFLSSAVVPARFAPEAERLHRTVARCRRAWAAEAILIVIAYVLAVLTIAPELCWRFMPCVAMPDTWHTVIEGSERRLTYAGAYAMLVALPLLNYWWLRWVWKIAIWTYYLFRVSRQRLMFVASHPDRTGGIGFVSRVQAQFAWVIFAYGISNVAAVVAYKIAIEDADITMMSVWGPIVGFAIGAPLLFTLPLFMFTKQLFRTKKRALRVYRQRAMERARALEKEWLNIGTVQLTDQRLDLEQQMSFAALFADIERMRVVPFDFRSIGQLFGSTFGSVATALPLLGLETQLGSWLQFLASVFSAFS